MQPVKQTIVWQNNNGKSGKKKSRLTGIICKDPVK